MARSPDPKSKAGFVRSFPSSTTAAEIVSKAKAKGIKLDVGYVYAVRTAIRRTAKNGAPGAAGAKRGPGRPPKAAEAEAPLAKRGRGRPRKSAPDSHTLSGARTRGASPGGLVAEIERIVEAKVAELLKSRLGTLFG